MRTRTVALGFALLLAACQQTGSGPANSATAGADNGAANTVAGSAATEGSPPPANDARPAEVTLAVTPAQVAQGATVTLTLSNGAGEQIGYNLCSSTLRTSQGRPVPTANVCTRELRTLKPGSIADYRYQLPVNMPAGGYRFVTPIERMESGGRVEVESPAFDVS